MWRFACSLLTRTEEQGDMRQLIAAALLVVFGAAPAMAQTTDDSPRTYNLTKILVAGGAVAIGTIVAAKSSETTTVTSAGGSSTTSTFSKSQLITGLSVAGVGG